MANGFVYLTAIVQSPRTKNPLTHIQKSHKRFFVYFFSPSLALSFFGMAFCRQLGLMIRDLLLILFHTDYVKNKSRIKINICCLYAKSWFCGRNFLCVCSPKSSFLSHAFIFFLSFISFLCFFSWWNSFFVQSCFARIFCSFWILLTIWHDFNRSNHSIGISSCLRLRQARYIVICTQWKECGECRKIDFWLIRFA